MPEQLVIPEPVRQLAQHPMRELPVPPAFEKIDIDGAMVMMTPLPTAQCVEPLGVEPDGIPDTVEGARAVAREHGKSVLAWWIAPEHAHLGPSLEGCGLVHRDTPGYEAIETAMALVSAPDSRGTESVEVKEVSSFEEFAAAARVSMEAFEIPESVRDEFEAELPTRYEETLHPDNPGHGFVALIDGKIVGAGTGAVGAPGVNLFGGAVHPDARGRGVYRALTVARWQLAVERGTPALTIQAGRMSKPIAQRLGFVQIAEVRLYVDVID